jgi:arylsulfatase A-like enzyme
MSLSRLVLLMLCACQSAALAVVAGDDRGGSRPNVLFLFSDDHQAGAIGAMGHPDLKTPHLDRLYGRGCVFTRTYIQGSLQPAVCVPSRAMMLTGRGLWRVASDFGPEHPSWLERFRAAGYATFATGKWHNGRPSFQRAASHGGGIFFGGMYDHRKMTLWDFAPETNYPPKAAALRDGFSTELFTGEAIRFLESRPKNQPFVAYVSYMAPHDPRVPPAAFRGQYDPARLAIPANFLPRHPFNNGEMTVRDERLAAWPRTEAELREHLADYYGMISHLDAEIGRLLDRLESLGLAESTYVVFAGDNGLALGQHGLMGKQNLYEHSIRVPLAIAGPGIRPGKRAHGLHYMMDIGPTLCELAGLPVSAGTDGRSLAPILNGTAPSGRETGRSEIYSGYMTGQRSLITDRWKLIRYPRVDRTQLFDLVSDPLETTDLSTNEQFAAIRETLRTRFDAARTEWGDPLGWSSEARDPDQVSLPPAP